MDSSPVEVAVTAGDYRIEHLVKMFQSQLFKRSFINTSLMIIQKKMNEKFLIKQRTQGPGSLNGGGGVGGPINGLLPEKEAGQKNLDKKKVQTTKDVAKKGNN